MKGGGKKAEEEVRIEEASGKISLRKRNRNEEEEEVEGVNRVHASVMEN